MDIPHFWRLTPFELATNRHGVWRYIPLTDTALVLAMVLWRLGGGADAFARSLVPGSIKRGVRRAILAVSDALRSKESRI